eukprot:symbB.v1.2.002935.t1/scaffold162.1/size290285/8
MSLNISTATLLSPGSLSAYHAMTREAFVKSVEQPKWTRATLPPVPGTNATKPMCLRTDYSEAILVAPDYTSCPGCKNGEEGVFFWFMRETSFGSYTPCPFKTNEKDVANSTNLIVA